MNKTNNTAATAFALPTDLAQYNSLVARSWNRSRDYGLSPSDRLLFDAPLVASGEEIIECNRLLLEYATPEMQQLHSALAMQDWVLACIDPQGVVLSTFSGSNKTTRELNQIFRIGVQMLEQNVGSTAPSCALVEQVPVVFSGTEHYLEEARQFSCLATPIFGLDGRLTGVLNLSSKQSVPSLYIFESLILTARTIENRLFMQLDDVLLVHLHHRPEILATPLEGLLAFDLSGKLRNANRIAREVLQLGSNLAGLDFADLFELPFAHVVRYRHHDLAKPLHLRSHLGSKLYSYITISPTKYSKSKPRSATAQLTKPPLPSTPSPCLQDPAVQAVLSRGHKAFAHDIPVLINGETGVGKEVFARLLHDGSNRMDEPFVAINCSSIPASLIESELFGYVEGAFTGSRKGGATGKIEQAHKGTLFLDEIGDMPLELQGRLLRVLQERSLTRLGSNQVIQVDFALICATHRDLKQLCTIQEFREDLYYRINGLRVTLPALRQRQDLAILIEHLLRAETKARQPLRLSMAAQQALLAYHWPGNIRQLYQVLRLAAALAEDEWEIDLKHLPEEIWEGHESKIERLAKIDTPQLHAGRTLQASGLCAIRSALEATGGNISAAARSLGIARATLYRKLKKLEQS